MTSTPRGTAPVVWTAGVLALLLAALGAVAVRDLAVDQGWAQGSSWTSAAVDAVDGLEASVALAVAGALVALVGLALLVVALRPGRVRHVPLDGAADAWITPRAVAALARSVADRSAGVVEASTASTSRSRVSIRVTTAGQPDAAARAAQTDVDAALRGLTRPTVVVSGRRADRTADQPQDRTGAVS